jgi:hypothetical protein
MEGDAANTTRTMPTSSSSGGLPGRSKGSFGRWWVLVFSNSSRAVQRSQAAIRVHLLQTA